jgi:DNA-binding NarL/FixJ family response regulator
LDDLLAAGRTSSLQRWVAAARAAGAEGGLIDYAESEARLRSAELDRAIALATQAAGSLDGDLGARAHVVAGTAAYLADRSEAAQAHADAATSSAEKEETQEDALWLCFLAGLQSQAPDLRARLKRFRRNARAGTKQSLVSAAGGLTLAMIEGGVGQAIDEARATLSLASEGTDAIPHTGLLSTYSYGLIMTCQYEKGLESLETLSRVAEASGIDFALRYAQLYAASAYIGLRRFAVADRDLGVLERETRDEPGSYFHGNVPIQRARLYASVGDLRRALDVLALGPAANGSRGLQGEFVGWQGLLLAASGEFESALERARDAEKASRGLEATALAAIARAIAALATDSTGQTADSYIAQAIATGAWDPVLIAVRAVPDLGRHIARQQAEADWLRRILLLSSDASLAALIGLRIPRTAKPKQNLSPRESEVHELLAQGLTNEEIAGLLHISVSTTKVHVKHIYEKLSVRSRLEAARALADDV